MKNKEQRRILKGIFRETWYPLYIIFISSLHLYSTDINLNLFRDSTLIFIRLCFFNQFIQFCVGTTGINSDQIYSLKNQWFYLYTKEKLFLCSGQINSILDLKIENWSLEVKCGTIFQCKTSRRTFVLCIVILMETILCQSLQAEASQLCLQFLKSQHLLFLQKNVHQIKLLFYFIALKYLTLQADMKDDITEI